MEAGLAMNAMFSSEELCVAAGLLLVSGRVVFLVPMRCAGKPTPNLYSFLFVYPFVFIAHFLAPSRIHPALPVARRFIWVARRFIWGHSPGDLLLDSLLCGSAREKRLTAKAPRTPRVNNGKEKDERVFFALLASFAVQSLSFSPVPRLPQTPRAVDHPCGTVALHFRNRKDLEKQTLCNC